MERMVAVAKSGKTIPLLYHEGMIHSHVFWLETDTGEVAGSLTSGLLTDGYNSRRFGYGSLMEHVRTRFTDPALMTCTDYKYQFNTYDALLNIGARGNNVTTILRRGFADEQGNEGIRMRCDDEDVFDTCSIDSRKTVNQLASVLRRKPCHFFYTFTPNEKECIGLRLIEEWTKSQEALKSLSGDTIMSLKDEFKYVQALRHSSASMKLRSWLEYSHQCSFDIYRTVWNLRYGCWIIFLLEWNFR